MAREGQELEGPGGFRLRLVRITDELLEMEARYPGTGVFPPKHLHPRQDEAFTVLEGEIRAVVGEEERRHGEGASFEVPAGTPHTMAAEVPTRMRWEVRPALRTAEFFERLYSGDPGDVLADFADEFRLA